MDRIMRWLGRIRRMRHVLALRLPLDDAHCAYICIVQAFFVSCFEILRDFRKYNIVFRKWESNGKFLKILYAAIIEFIMSHPKIHGRDSTLTAQ